MFGPFHNRNIYAIHSLWADREWPPDVKIPLILKYGFLRLFTNAPFNGAQVTPQASSEGEVNLEAGKEAAQACALTMLSLLREALGSLDRVVCYSAISIGLGVFSWGSLSSRLGSCIRVLSKWTELSTIPWKAKMDHLSLRSVSTEANRILTCSACQDVYLGRYDLLRQQLWWIAAETSRSPRLWRMGEAILRQIQPYTLSLVKLCKAPSYLAH